jgi:general bacterial porin, GBP family
VKAMSKQTLACAVWVALGGGAPLLAQAEGHATKAKVEADAPAVPSATADEVKAIREQMQALADRLNKLEESNHRLEQENADLKAQGAKLAQGQSEADKAKDAQSDAIAKTAAKVAAVAAGNGVELYGILDVGYATIDHSLVGGNSFSSTFQPFDPVAQSIATGANGQTGMINGGLQDSRWGIRGNRDVGDGFKVFFNLESGINLPSGTLNNNDGTIAGTSSVKTTSGSTTTTLSHAATIATNSSLNGQLFGRQAFLGVSHGDWGAIAFGRVYNPTYDVFSTYDPAMKADVFSPFGISGTVGGGGGVSELSRIDNSAKYTNKFGHFNVGAVYTIGGAAGISDANSGYAVNAGYDNGTAGVQVVYTSYKDVIKAGTNTWSVTSPYYLKGTLYNTESLLIAGKVKASDEVTFKGGFEHYALSKAHTQLTATSVVDGMLWGVPTTFASYGDDTQNVDIYFFGGDYKLTPKVTIAAGYYDFRYGAYTTGGHAIPTGSIQDLSLIVDYTFAKQLDWYFGYMHSQFGGQKGDAAISTSTGAASPNFSSNSVLGSGLRFKF